LPRLLLLASLGTLPLVGCKQTGPGAHGPQRSDIEAPARKPGMPRPYRVPSNLELALHLAAPADVLDVAAAHVPGTPSARGLVALTLGRSGEVERALSGHVDPTRPWDAAWVEGQLVAQLPIAPESASAIEGLLAGKPPVGKFGAVRIATAGDGPKLAWFDRDTNMLTLADDERGLATGRDVAIALSQQPVYFVATASQAQRFGLTVPFARIEVSGTGSDSLDVVMDGVAPEHLARLSEIRDGALTGLVEAPQIAAGATTRYAHADRDVKSLMSRGQRMVDGVPFFVRGNADDLLRRTGSVVRSWNGRVMVGVGPKQHVLLGLGTNDPAKTGSSFYYLMAGITSNLSLAKNFGVSVPRVRWAKEKTRVDGHVVSVVALEQANKHVPAEYHSLIDSRGDLRIAMAFPPRSGAAMIVAGPSADAVLGKWLQQTKGATPASDSTGDLAATTFALDAKTVRMILGGDPAPTDLLRLDARRAPTKTVITRRDDRITLAVRGPQLETIVAATAATDQAKRATRPARANPTAPTRKPVR
jgi:hypothetical protein